MVPADPSEFVSLPQPSPTEGVLYDGHLHGLQVSRLVRMVWENATPSRYGGQAAFELGARLGQADGRDVRAEKHRSVQRQDGNIVRVDAEVAVFRMHDEMRYSPVFVREFFDDGSDHEVAENEFDLLLRLSVDAVSSCHDVQMADERSTTTSFSHLHERLPRILTEFGVCSTDDSAGPLASPTAERIIDDSRSCGVAVDFVLVEEAAQLAAEQRGVIGTGQGGWVASEANAAEGVQTSLLGLAL